MAAREATEIIRGALDCRAKTGDSRARDRRRPGPLDLLYSLAGRRAVGMPSRPRLRGGPGVFRMVVHHVMNSVEENV